MLTICATVIVNNELTKNNLAILHTQKSIMLAWLTIKRVVLFSEYEFL